jgi:hypothetical protein
VKTRSAITSLARRSRLASACSMCMETSGRSSSHGRSASWASAATVASVTALADEVLGRGSNSDSSPNISPGPSTLIRFSRPSAAARVSLILPSSTTYKRSPPCPSRNRCSPRDNLTSDICRRSARAFSSSSPSKSGARLSTTSASSTDPPCRPLCRWPPLSAGWPAIVSGRALISVNHPAPTDVLGITFRACPSGNDDETNITLRDIRTTKSSHRRRGDVGYEIRGVLEA